MPRQTGRLEAIWLKPGRREPMHPVDGAELVAGRGLVGNADQGRRRQVTVISREAWDEVMEELGAAVSPDARRANFLVSGLDLEETRGSMLQIGPCRLEVQGETKPCERMEEALAGLEEALSSQWRGGVFCTVEQGGRIRVGEEVVLA